MSKANYHLISAEANLRSKLSAQRGRSQNQMAARFWIITMMLVLFGLSTLKLR